MWSFYNTETGIFVGRTFSGHPIDLAANTPEGCSALPGAYDHHTERLDVTTGMITEYQPPAPPDTVHHTYEWDLTTKRWIAVPTVEQIAMQVRSHRSALLSACDWVVARAMESGQPVPDAWVAYRTALRGISAQPGFPHSVQWPSSPA